VLSLDARHFPLSVVVGGHGEGSTMQKFNASGVRVAITVEAVGYDFKLFLALGKWSWETST
jgi:hypothetical protein